MFTPSSKLPNSPEDYEQSFVRGVEAQSDAEPVRSRRVTRVLWIGWALITLKCALVWWACRAYNIPVHPLWVVGPTVFMAAAGSWIYWHRR